MFAHRFPPPPLKIAALIIILFLAACGGTASDSRPLSVQTGPIEKEQAPLSTKEAPKTVGPQISEPEENAAADGPNTLEPAAKPIEEQLAVDTLKFEPDYNPLTGEIVEDVEALERRPIAVKISNSSWVRPQRGLANADIIYEHLTEGGITRFTAIFYSKEGNRVGSIRSGRLIDLEIPLMYDAAFAYSGSSHQIKMMIAASNFFDRVVSPDFGHRGFYRDYGASSSGRLEDTMFTDTRVVRSALAERGQDTPPVLENAMVFQSEPTQDGVPVRSVEIRYLATSAFWSYDQKSGKFLRWSDGSRHLDANTNQQLAFDNVVLVQAVHINTEIIEDSGGSPSIQVQLWGEGPATVFRNGLQFDGTWRRAQPGHMLTFYDKKGEPLFLKPGSSFFQIVPVGYKQVYIEPS